MNEPELGDTVPMVSSLPTAMLAASSKVWRRQSNTIGGTGGKRIRAKGTLRFASDAVFSVPPDLVVGATKVVVIGQMPITRSAIGVLTANCILGCLGHRSMGLFPALRVTPGSNSCPFG